MTEGAALGAAGACLLELAMLAGQPLIVTVLDPASRERVMRIDGILASADEATVVVESVGRVPPLPSFSPVHLDILVDGQIWRYRTRLHPLLGVRGYLLHLQAPDERRCSHRRKYPRTEPEASTDLLVTYGDKTQTAWLRDLSAGGASMLTAEPINEGSEILISLKLDAALQVEGLKASVVRCSHSPNGLFVVAVQVHGSEEQQAALRGWVRRHTLQSWLY